MLISDKESYTKVGLQGRSKSVVRFNPNSSQKNQEDIQEEMERERETRYNQTLSDFRQVEEVVGLFEQRKEFNVIRMYYFNADIGGNSLSKDAPRNTLSDIALDWKGDEKTIRRWKNKFVNNMAICLFGIEAAVQIGAMGER